MTVDRAIENLLEIQSMGYGKAEINVWPYDGSLRPVKAGDVSVRAYRIVGWNMDRQAWDTVPCEPFVLFEE